MERTEFELIDAGEPHAVEALVGPEGVRLSPDAVETALGWELRPEGLCREDRCVPLRDAASRITPESVDLAALAELLGRPLALDVEERVASLAASARERGAALASLRAPDFTLPDLSGKQHSLSEQRGKKVLLIAYASW